MPRSEFRLNTVVRATAMYIASRIAAGALIVMLVETLSSGMPEKRLHIIERRIETPTLPTSPAAIGSSAS